nr:hypothetical protein [Methanobacterium formicicum]
MYISSLVLGLAGGFRQDLIPFMFPLWMFCLFYHDHHFKRVVTALAVLGVSILLWLVPSIILAPGLENYLHAGGHFSASFTTSSVLFGPLSNHLLMDGLLFSWLMIGLGFIGGFLIVIFLIWKRKTLLDRKMLKNPRLIFFRPVDTPFTPIFNICTIIQTRLHLNLLTCPHFNLRLCGNWIFTEFRSKI